MPMTKQEIESAPRGYSTRTHSRISLCHWRVTGFPESDHTLLRTLRRWRSSERAAGFCRAPSIRRWRPSTGLTTRRYVKDQVLAHTGFPTCVLSVSHETQRIIANSCLRCQMHTSLHDQCKMRNAKCNGLIKKKERMYKGKMSSFCK